MEQTQPIFNVRDIVRFKNGDGRPHYIIGRNWINYPFKDNDGCWQYTFPDGAGLEPDLQYYIDQRQLNKTLNFLENIDLDKYTIANGEVFVPSKLVDDYKRMLLS